MPDRTNLENIALIDLVIIGRIAEHYRKYAEVYQIGQVYARK